MLSLAVSMQDRRLFRQRSQLSQYCAWVQTHSICVYTDETVFTVQWK